MQLGVLVSIASEAPSNFLHFVLANGVYETSGAQPIPGCGKVDFPAIAIGAGYARAYSISDLENLRSLLPMILIEEGPILVSLEIDREPPSQEGPSREAGSLTPSGHSL
jgi:phosphonopyruvate decarboxylase